MVRARAAPGPLILVAATPVQKNQARCIFSYDGCNKYDQESQRNSCVENEIGGSVMRWLFLRAVMTAALFVSLANAQEPSVEVLGVKIVRGMPEAEVRAAFPYINCAEKAPGVDSSLDFCSVSDGVPPGADGEVTFKDGYVFRATRNWFIPEEAGPYDVLLMLNDILTRLTGEELAACAKIETHADNEPVTTSFVLPEKVLTVQMHTIRGNYAFFRESLRVNPVPSSYRVRGKKMQGNEWCAYIN